MVLNANARGVGGKGVEGVIEFEDWTERCVMGMGGDHDAVEKEGARPVVPFAAPCSMNICTEQCSMADLQY